MVQNTKSKRGRPRAYDPDTALARAMDVFWSAGYAATSLDALSEATDMNRPSLYGAFGDKQAIYLTLLDRYRAMARADMKRVLAGERPLRDEIAGVYEHALAIYFPDQGNARGCFMIGTAVTEAAMTQEVRKSVSAGLREIDDAFEARLRLAQQKGELGRDQDPAMLAKLASSVLYFLAVRSRTGDSRASLQAVAQAGVAMICGKAR